MLVLSRKEGERISIGPEIEVTVLGIRRGSVKLGFSGPPQVSIQREEVKQRMASAQPDCFALRTTGKPSKPLS